MPYATVDTTTEERVFDVHDFTPTVSELESGSRLGDGDITHFTKVGRSPSVTFPEATSGEALLVISDPVGQVSQAISSDLLAILSLHQAGWAPTDPMPRRVVTAATAITNGVLASLLNLILAFMRAPLTTLSSPEIRDRFAATPILEYLNAETTPTERRPVSRLSPAATALGAVSDVQEWLVIGRDDVARLAGYAVGSPKNWQQGRAPYPATVRHLFDIHALVGSLVRTLGLERARFWLSGQGSNGKIRRDSLGLPDGLQSVIVEAADLIFERPSLTPLSGLDEDGEILETSPQPELFSGRPVRRARRRL